MRPTTKSEKFLLGVLGLVLAGGVLFYGGKALLQKQSVLDLERASLRADQAEARIDLEQAPLWSQRQHWIGAHEPVLGDEGDTRARVLGDVKQSALDHKLEILEQNLGDARHGAGGVKIDAEIKLKGSMESLCRWLADLQQPESFYAVDKFSLKADDDQKSIDCTLQVARFFREKAK